MEGFSNSIKQWVELDNKVYKSNKIIKTIKKDRDSLGNLISKYMIDNNMNNTLINISDGKIKCHETKTQTPLSYSFLFQCFNDYFNNSEESNKLIIFIKKKRGCKKNVCLKRSYTNINKLI
jgi:hypothetical protein